MKAWFAEPIFWSGMLVGFIIVGNMGLFDLESLEGTVVIEEDMIGVIDENGRGTNGLMGKTLAVKISKCRGKAVCPSQEKVPALILFKHFESFGRFV